MRGRPLLALLFVIAGCAALAACSSGSPTASTASAGGGSAAGAAASASAGAAASTSGLPTGDPVSITVGVSPSTASAAVYLAQQKEFAEQGLTVNLATIQSGAEAIPRLLNGELTFALGDAAGTITAASNGVGIAATGVATVSPSDPAKDYSSIVAKNPDLKNATDLAGHTVAVNQLNGIAELTAKAAIDKQGGDSSQVQFVELAFPQMNDAVAAGRVDAALVVEPFLTAAKSAGLHVVLAPQAYAVAGLPSTIFVASQSYAGENVDVVKRFNTAVGEAGARANADPDLARQIAGTYTQLPAATLSAITLPTYAEKAADVQGMRQLLELMNKYSMLEQQPDMDTLLATAGN